jgi:hypothetical protein
MIRASQTAMPYAVHVNGNRILTPWRHLNLDPSTG